jgi:hypothetical protein
MKLKKNQVTHSTSNCAVCVCSSERTSVAIRYIRSQRSYFQFLINEPFWLDTKYLC